MQPLSAPISDLLFLTYLFYLEVSHDPERHSDDVILRREPKNLEILRPAQAGLRMTIAGVWWVVREFFPYIFLRRKCKTNGMKFARNI
jgi:hypothetical protein